MHPTRAHDNPIMRCHSMVTMAKGKGEPREQTEFDWLNMVPKLDRAKAATLLAFHLYKLGTNVVCCCEDKCYALRIPCKYVSDVCACNTEEYQSCPAAWECRLWLAKYIASRIVWYKENGQNVEPAHAIPQFLGSGRTSCCWAFADIAGISADRAVLLCWKQSANFSWTWLPLDRWNNYKL